MQNQINILCGCPIDHSPDSGRHAVDASADCLLKAILLPKLLQFS
jgi:hypothetical protein